MYVEKTSDELNIISQSQKTHFSKRLCSFVEKNIIFRPNDKFIEFFPKKLSNFFIFEDNNIF